MEATPHGNNQGHGDPGDTRGGAVGAPDHVVRTVTENSRTLKFTNQGFEKE